MIYSRFLYTEYEMLQSEIGEGAFTVFSTQQPFDLKLKPVKEVCIQTFAVLWGKVIDTRLISAIEKSIVRGVLSPVRLLHASECVLMVIYDYRVDEATIGILEHAWQTIASEVLYEEWTAELMPEGSAGSLSKGGQILRRYGDDMLADPSLDIDRYEDGLCLFQNEWIPNSSSVIGVHAHSSEAEDPSIYGHPLDPNF
ncbi:MAG: hypothetical protein ACN6P2_11895 [Pseudomonas palmensis]|uniref:hypothetical protein n=1 Tax=Pseudomonas palmensis TaxID=2815362 RepID=UPI003D13ABE0